jgi:cytochrome b561
MTTSVSRYTRIAIFLHWAIAALFLAAYASVYYRRWFTEPKTPENFTALQIHLAVGVTIAALVLLRVIWRLTHQPPPLPDSAPELKRAAHVGHLVLYAFMIVMPITGYLGTGAATEYFGIPKFADTQLFAWLVTDKLGMTFQDFEKPMDFIHKNSGAYLVWVLILGHAGAALYHHFGLRDGLLNRMRLGSR